MDNALDFWSELHGRCREATNPKCLETDGRWHRNMHPTWQPALALSMWNRRGTHASWWSVRSTSPSCLPCDEEGAVEVTGTRAEVDEEMER